MKINSGDPVEAENIGEPQVPQNSRVTCPLIPVTVHVLVSPLSTVRSALGIATTVANALPVALRQSRQ